MFGPRLIPTARCDTPARRARRFGFSSLMATFYVALFSGLAIAFTAFTTLNTSISGNTRNEQLAYLAAESGLSILRYHISEMTFETNATSNEMFTALADQLGDVFNASLNVPGQVTTDGVSTITVPDISIDLEQPGARFSTRITRGEGAQYYLCVTGKFADITRTLRVALEECEGPVDDVIIHHGISSQGSIRIDGAAYMRSNLIGGGSVMSMDPDSLRPIRVNGAGTFDGDFYMVKDGVTGADVFSSSSSVFIKADGSGYEGDVNLHTHAGVRAPDWPRVNVDPFVSLINTLPHKRIVAGTDTTAIGPLHNLYIAANANPTFKNGEIITGMVYVEWPNNVTFNGSVAITGIIVCQPPPYEPAITAAANCSMRFNGAVTSRGVEHLPDTAEYQGLREQTGTFILAPDYATTFNGAMGTLNGSIYTSELQLNGATTGRVRGGIIVDRRRQFTKFDSVDLYFEVDPNQTTRAGLEFDHLKSLRPVAGSYEEL